MTTIVEFPESASAPSTAYLVIYDSAESNATRKISHTNLFSGFLSQGDSPTFGTVSCSSGIIGSATVTTLTLSNSLSVNGGSNVEKLTSSTASVAVPDIAAGGSADVSVSVSGVATADFVHAAWAGAIAAGLIVNCWPSSSGTVTFRFFNASAALIPSATYSARLIISNYS